MQGERSPSEKGAPKLSRLAEQSAAAAAMAVYSTTPALKLRVERASPSPRDDGTNVAADYHSNLRAPSCGRDDGLRRMIGQAVEAVVAAVRYVMLAKQYGWHLDAARNVATVTSHTTISTPITTSMSIDTSVKVGGERGAGFMKRSCPAPPRCH